MNSIEYFIFKNNLLRIASFLKLNFKLLLYNIEYDTAIQLS